MTDAANTAEIVRRVGGDPLDLPFWEACREGRFLLHRCEICRRYYWPASRCIEHGARAMEWIEASGLGTVYTYTVIYHAYTAAMKAKVPYPVGVIKLSEGPFMHSLVIDCPLGVIAVDLPVQVVMQTHESGLVLPMFQPLR
jgi:hypothetical protein